MRTDLRLKIAHFIRRNKKIMGIAFLIWLVVFAVNQMIKNYEAPAMPEVTYTPHTSIMNSSSSTPSPMQSGIEDMIGEYIGYCNDGNYQKAFEMISDDCKTYSFDNDITKFVKHVLTKMPNKKEYSIQDYSNMNGLYVYQIKYTDNFLATGLTNQQYSYTEEKMTFQLLKDGVISMSVGNFIKQIGIQGVAENEYLKVDIKSKRINYSVETYTIRITNRSEYTIVISDNVEAEEVVLRLPQEYRTRSDYDMHVVLNPNESKEITVTFPKFADDGDTSEQIIFNAVRVMEVYSGTEVDVETIQRELENAISKFSMQIPIVEK